MKFDVHWSSKKIPGVISDIMAEVANIYIPISKGGNSLNIHWITFKFGMSLGINAIKFFLFFVIFKNMDGYEDVNL